MSRGLNLIRKEYQEQKILKSEINWYKILNIALVILSIVLGVTGYLTKLYFDGELDKKLNEIYRIARSANGCYSDSPSSVSDCTRSNVLHQINVINDKARLLEQLADRNFLFNAFYDRLSKIYPKAKINSFAIARDSQDVEVSLEINENGYEELPSFITAIRNNSDFGGNVELVTFSFVNDYAVSASEFYSNNQIFRSTKLNIIIKVPIVKFSSGQLSNQNEQ